MLKIYSGYHLTDKTENITFNIHELQPHQEVIEIVTNFVQTSRGLEDETLVVGISTNNPLVIATIEAIAMGTNHISNLKYVYVTKEGTEHISHYIDDRCEGEHYPNSEYMDLKTRYYHAFYKRLRKE